MLHKIYQPQVASRRSRQLASRRSKGEARELHPCPRGSRVFKNGRPLRQAPASPECRTTPCRGRMRKTAGHNVFGFLVGRPGPPLGTPPSCSRPSAVVGARPQAECRTKPCRGRRRKTAGQTGAVPTRRPVRWGRAEEVCQKSLTNCHALFIHTHTHTHTHTPETYRHLPCPPTGCAAPTAAVQGQDMTTVVRWQKTRSTDGRRLAARGHLKETY